MRTGNEGMGSAAAAARAHLGDLHIGLEVAGQLLHSLQQVGSLCILLPLCGALQLVCGAGRDQA